MEMRDTGLLFDGWFLSPFLGTIKVKANKTK